MRKSILGVAAAVATLALSVGLAGADNIQAGSNDVDLVTPGTQVDAVVGVARTVNYNLVASNNDNHNGCNASAENPTSVTVSAPIGVSVSPNPFQFTACATLVPVVFTAAAEGTYSITVSASGGDGSYNTNPGKFDLVVGAAPVASNTAPTVTVTGVEDGESYEIGSVPAATCVVTDAEDGGSSFPATLSAVTGPLASYGLGSQTASCSYTDAGDLSASDNASYSIVDTTAPEVTLAGPADGASYVFGSVPAASCTATDNVAVDGACAVTGYGTTVGEHTITGSATDVAGNPGSATATYTVLAWTPTGYYSPVDMGGVLNTVKAGSTVPLKFEVFAGSTELTTVSGTVASFRTQKISCTTLSGAPEDVIEVTSTGGTALRYDTTGGQFIQNWQTPKSGAGTCHTATATLLDGSTITASFKLK